MPFDSGLSLVTIGITSFLRYGYLWKCIDAIAQHLPECKVIVADDSRGDRLVHKWKGFQRSWIDLPFDSGLSLKRNAIVKACETPLFLLWTDDFEADDECRTGVLKMLEFLDSRRTCQVACGRVDNRPYEANLEYRPGEYIKETRVIIPPSVAAHPPFENGRTWGIRVDLAINYFLGRTDVMKRFPWPEEMKIGGEHVCFFLDLKLANQEVYWLPGVNVKTMTLGPEAQDPRYPAYRARAYELGHAAMKRRYNIKTYYGMAGDVS